jgi:hypothetical protein
MICNGVYWKIVYQYTFQNVIPLRKLVPGISLRVNEMVMICCLWHFVMRVASRHNASRSHTTARQQLTNISHFGSFLRLLPPH